MILLEIAAQAVRGMSPAVRAQLKAGYQVLVGPEAACAPLAGLFIALCYPDGRGGDAAYLAPGQKTGKGGFGLKGHDGAAWRVVRDLGGAGALHKFNASANKFEVLTQDASEMAQTLRAAAGLPPRTTFEQLFCFKPDQLPSRRPKGSSEPAPKGAKGKAAAKASGPIDVDAEHLKLRALEDELPLAREVAEVQFKIDGLASEQFALEQRLRVYDEARGQVSTADQVLATAPTLESLGLSALGVDTVRKFPAEQQKAKDALGKLVAEREEHEYTQQEAPQSSVGPLWRDNRFVGALGFGVAALAGAMFLDGAGRYLALLGIPAFSAAALFALQWVDDLQSTTRSSGKVDRFAAREKKLAAELEAVNARAKAVLQQAGVESPEELFALLDRREVAQAQRDEAVARLRALEQDPETAAAVQRAQALKAEQDALTQQLTSQAGGYIRSPGEVEREIAQVQERIRQAGLPPEEPEFKSVEEGVERYDDPSPALLMLASDHFHADVPTVWATVKDRCAQYVGALSDRRYHGLEVDKDGRAKALAPGRSVPLGELPGQDLDLVFLGLKLCLVERAMAASKLPVFFEEGVVVGWPEGRKALLLKMLRHLGTLTQVLHVTPAGHAAGPNDAVVGV